MARYVETIERGIFRRKDPKTGALLAPLWITYRVNGKPRMESTKQTSLVVARQLLAQRQTAALTGTAMPLASLTITTLLDRVESYYVKNRLASLRTVRSHLDVLRRELGHLKVKDCTAPVIDAFQEAQQATGITNATVNKRCEVLRRAFNLAVRAGTIPTRPYIARLKVKPIRARYIQGADQALLAEHLPDYLIPVIEFARLNGTRRGQLTRTRKVYIDRERAVLTWPGNETKNGEPHMIPLDDAALAIIDRVLPTNPWCPFLFHGPLCAPGRRPNRHYGCVGDFKKAWAKACIAAGMPVGRKNGGLTFHYFRNTAVTDMLGSGRLSIDEAMQMSAHKTTSMVRHYNLGNLTALRERLNEARVETNRLQEASDAERTATLRVVK